MFFEILEEIFPYIRKIAANIIFEKTDLVFDIRKSMAFLQETATVNLETAATNRSRYFCKQTLIRVVRRCRKYNQVVWVQPEPVLAHN